jgi:hypothetical protein
VAWKVEVEEVQRRRVLVVALAAGEHDERCAIHYNACLSGSFESDNFSKGSSWLDVRCIR